MSTSNVSDGLINALAAMQRAMAEFEMQRSDYQLRTGKDPDVEFVLEALMAAGTALLVQNEMAAAPEIDGRMTSAMDAAWFAEAALRRASARLAAYPAE